MSLNPEQQKIVNTAIGKCAVLAGAGSGKTYTLIELLVKLHKKDKVPLENIFVSTFTNKAGNELKERIGKRLGLSEEKIEKLWIGTTHALGVRYLTEKGLKFKLLDENESQFFLKQSFKELNSDLSNILTFDLLRSTVSLKRSRNCKWSEALPNVSEEMIERIRKIYQHFKKYKISQNLLDFDDILYYFAHLLKKYGTKFDWVIMDEAQDLARTQYLIAELLTNKNSLIIGDQKQAIFGWRGAAPELFAENVKKAEKVFTLSENYRSSGEIINFVNSFIQGTQFSAQTLKAQAMPSEIKPALHVCINQVQTIAHNVKQDCQKYRKREIAVLGRSVKSKTAQELQLMLKTYNIPFIVRGGTDFLSIDYVQKYLAIVKSLSSPTLASVVTALDCIRGIGDVYSKRIAPQLLQFRASNIKIPASVDKVRMEQFISLYKNRSRDSVLFEGLKFLEDTFLKIRYKNEALEKSKVLRSTIIDFLLQQDSLVTGINDLLLKKNEKEDQKDQVVVSTIHQAKGLEFDSVHLIDFQEGNIPSARSTNIQEEWCVAYTALTRPRRRLRFYQSYMNRYREYMGICPFLKTVNNNVYDVIPDRELRNYIRANEDF